MKDSTPNSKKCSICKQTKSLIDFYKNASRKDGLSHTCKVCMSEKSKEHYQNNKIYYKKQSSVSGKKIYIRNRKIILDAKNVPCTDCGIKFPPPAMEFDHIPGKGKKKFNIGYAGRIGKKALLEEMAKCEVVCANCHAIRTFNRI